MGCDAPLPRLCVGKGSSVSVARMDCVIRPSAGTEQPCTGCLHRPMLAQVWDLRKVGLGQKACLASFEYRRSINSAFFNPTGTHLLAVTQNNTLCIFPETCWVGGRAEGGVHFFFSQSDQIIFFILPICQFLTEFQQIIAFQEEIVNFWHWIDF